MADGGRFHHVRAQGRDHERRAVTHIFARVGAGSLFKSFTLTVNGALTRNECVIEMVGDDAVAHVAGAALGDGRRAISTTTTPCSSPMAPSAAKAGRCSRRCCATARSGVFQGKILVKPGAQKTDGYQISQSLLLDDDSQFLAKPELEIYADDVKCSHGSTSGAIDEAALFYLRSRGVPRRGGDGAAGAGVPGRGDRRDRGRAPDVTRSCSPAGRLAVAASRLTGDMSVTDDILRSYRAPARW